MILQLPLQKGARTRGFPSLGAGSVTRSPFAWGLILELMPNLFTEPGLLRGPGCRPAILGAVEIKSVVQSLILVTSWA